MPMTDNNDDDDDDDDDDPCHVCAMTRSSSAELSFGKELTSKRIIFLQERGKWS